MKKIILVSSAAAGLAAAAVIIPALAFASGPWFVAPTGLDTNDCLSLATPCLTIQVAVDKASPGDTVNVATGTYAEHVTVAKSLTLKGANAGIVGNGVRGAESVITGTSTGALQITADNVTIDGFEIMSASNALGTGIHLAATQTGAEVKNNLITGNQIGIYANSAGASSIDHNLFDGNNEAGASGGSAIYSEFTNALTIDNNEFKNHTTNNPIIFGATAADVHQNDVISNNSIHNNGCGCSAIYALALKNASFTGNDITASSSDIYLGGGDHTVAITNNILHSTRGVNVADDGLTYPPSATPFGLNTGITINRNSLTGHTIAGVDNSQPGQTLAVDATCNWWGAASGPGPVGPGSGDPVTAGVTFSPWLAASDLAGACTGGTSTSTVKVTIDKFIDGAQATASTSNSSTFPMNATWSSTSTGSGSGSFGLGPIGFNSANPYEAVTADMTTGASYSTNEDVTDSVVGATCAAGKPFALVGYSTGTSLAAAMAATATTTAPNFTNLTADQFVIVWNHACSPPVTSPTDMNQCKNGGWKDFTNPSFKNQGQCVSSVVSHKQ